MSGSQNNYNDLDDIYSDLSDEQDKKKKAAQSVKHTQPSQPPVIIKMPDGRAFVPPPPPPSSKPVLQTRPPPDQPTQVRNPQHHQQQQNYHHQNNQSQQPQRQRKNMIYIKNISRSYNKQQALTTFFRSYGNVKSIKTFQQSNTAVVRFQKQQDAYKFMQSKPNILNRSYIAYDSVQDFVVPADKIAEREKDQQQDKTNANEKQIAIMKENNETVVADKYRALLYLMKNKNKLSQQQIFQIEKQMAKCRKIKQIQGDAKQLTEMLENFENNYDWTLTYKVITKQLIEKKKIISKFNKYGPIGEVHIRLSQLTTNEPTQPTHQAPTVNPSEPPIEQNIPQDKIGTIKIKFLGVRSSWDMYLNNFRSLNIEIEKSKLNDIYQSWFLKKQEERVKAAEQQKQLEKKDVFEQALQDASKQEQPQQKAQMIGTQQPEQIVEPQKPNVQSNEKKEENLEDPIKQPIVTPQDESQEKKEAEKGEQQ